MMRPALVSLGQLLFSLLTYVLIIVFFGLALAPGIALVSWALASGSGQNTAARFILLGCAISGGYFLFGFSLIILVGATRIILRLRLKEGDYPIYSWDALKWAFITALYLMINFTFIDFILLTPFVNLLLRMLGAKLGKNVQINSKYIYDTTLLEIGDNTVVGGWAFIVGHVVEHGVLKLRKVRIGRNVTIGTHAKIMPGCQIGDNAIIGASAVLLKNTKVEPGAVYYGVPAEQVKPGYHRGESSA